MAVTYSTVSQVASRCNFLGQDGGKRAVFGTDPKIPTLEEVEDMINEAEEWINDNCQTAWGDLYLQITDELQDLHSDYMEQSVHLDHANVMDFSTGEGDKLEVWNGIEWVDWIVNKTEGRNSDFFVDYKIGKIYFLSSVNRADRKNIRVTYRVNSGSTVPLPISYAASYLAGINILNSEYATVAFPEGEGEELSSEQMINRWWRMVLRKLRPYLKSGLVTGMPFQRLH